MSSTGSLSPAPEVLKIVKRKRNEPPDDEPESDSETSSYESDEELEQLETEVLSHAERRRQKKETKRAAKLKEEGSPAIKKRRLKDGSTKVVDAPSNATKRQNSVWVGNMSFKTQQDNLQTFFRNVGEITRINMPTKAPAGPGMKPENRGFAYVDFATPEAKMAAIALSEQPLLGRKLLIKDGDSFEGRPAAVPGENLITDPTVVHRTHSKTAQKILRAQKQPAAPTLFFGNLGFETTEDSIRQLLEAHRHVTKKGKAKETTDSHADEGVEEANKGKDVWIRKVRMGTFEDSGLCKGFAFVDFTSIDNATSALINLKNHHLNGRKLNVEYASPDAVRRGAPKSGKPADGSSKGRRPLSAGYKKTRTYPTRPKPEDAGPDASERPVVQGQTPTELDPKKRREKQERIPSNGDISKGVRHKGPKSRPKPGAALALAKRESAAIVPNQGQKITF